MSHHWQRLPSLPFLPFGNRFCGPQDGRSSSTSQSRPPTSLSYRFSGGAGALEAADPVQGGIATRVAVFADPPSGDDHEFIRRGLPYEDASARQIRQLRWLGVTDVMQIPGTEAGTEGEGQVLPPWCAQHQFRSIVFVAARDHSRRWRRVLNRVMKGPPDTCDGSTGALLTF